MTDKTKTKSRPATAADIRGFFGKGAPRSVRARVLEINGEIVGIAGYYLGHGSVMVFSDIREGIPKMTIWREAVSLMRNIRLPATCIAEESSGPFLERLGWQHVGPSELGEVYKWQH